MNAFHTSTALKVLGQADVLLIIAEYLDSSEDVSSLSRSNRRLYDILTPVLYRKIECSLRSVCSLANAVRKNEKFSRYCRSLSIDTNGEWGSDREVGAFNPTDTLLPHPSDCDEEAEEMVQRDIEHVLNQCGGRGRLKVLSIDLENVWERKSTCIHWMEMKLFKGIITTSRWTLQELSLRFGNDCMAPLDELIQPSQHSFPALRKLVLDVRSPNSHVKEFLSSFTNVEMLRLTLDLVPYSEDTNPDIIPVPEYGTIFEKVKSLDLSLTLYSTMKFSGFCVQRFLSSFPNVETLDLMILSKKRYAKASLGSPISYNTTFPRLVNLFIGLETDTKQDMLIASKSGYIDYCACLAEAGLLGDSALYEILMGNSTLEYLSLAFRDEPPELKGTFDSLKELTICNAAGITDKWIALMNQAPCLKRVIVRRSINFDAIKASIESFEQRNNAFLNDNQNITEFDIRYRVLVENITNEDQVYDRLSVCEHLETIITSCSASKSLRVLSLSYFYEDDPGLRCLYEKVNLSLPDEHTLRVDVPPTLEYVILEDPCKKKVYKLERGVDTINMVYTGEREIAVSQS